MKSLALISVSAEPLDLFLGNLKEHLAANYTKYKEQVAVSGVYSRCVLHIFCVTAEERDRTSKIEKKSKSEIAGEIKKLFDLYPAGSDISYFEEQLNKFQWKAATKKTDYIALYFDVLQYFQQQMAQTVVESVEDES